MADRELSTFLDTVSTVWEVSVETVFCISLEKKLYKINRLQKTQIKMKQV